MSGGYTTRWSVIHGAAQGNEPDREEFVRRYQDVARAYLGARWANSRFTQEIDDAVQEVFLRCFKPEGVLERFDPARAGGFRPFFFGTIRHVALSFERDRARQRAHPADDSSFLDGVAADEEGLSTILDRAWRQAILRDAVEYQAECARDEGPEAIRRVELLRLRFHEGLPIREIARRWNVDAARLHYEYAKARDEFRAALHDVVAFHHPGSPEEVRRECAQLFGNQR
jgi:RNA polymerase sigma-70 factor (ECF subfamily)